jgi:NAD(P)-dependent dehydrogenase (short-subunit alcohol dehydrogenase family)
MRESLEGTDAVVTGAGRGLGRAVARALAADGARIWAVDRTNEELDETVALIERAGARVTALRRDLADPGQCREVATEVASGASRVSVLVNAAAVLQEATVADTTLDDWASTLAINLTAPYVLSRAFAPRMVDRGGSLINVSSRAGTMPFAREAAYCASKHGIEALTKCLALELADAPVSVNTITPGLCIKPTGLTEAAAAVAPSAQRRQWQDPLELGPAFAFLARLEGEVSGLRFDASHLAQALDLDGAEQVLAHAQELAE